uniref:Baculoviral IAP repeat-containing protein 3 n=1 Tax=Phallusia mammillata TaxID=59560 RepID=A0A6F9D6W2_9ASCI|nr:baculoviral IAP repeat-containing protein 3 [Phallusia mammillata]
MMGRRYKQHKNEMEFNFNFSVTVRSDGIKHEQLDFPVNENAKREVYRIASFKKCQKKMPAIQLALAGFYYISPGDRVQCFSCAMVVEDFQIGDSPLSMKWHKPSCLFIGGGGNSGNISLNESSSISLPSSSESASSSELQKIKSNEAKKYLLIEWISEIHKILLSSLNLYKEIDRRQTFTSDWNFYHEVSFTNSVAHYGFYYLGNGSKTQCISCGVICQFWSTEVDANEVHRNAQPICRLLNNEDTSNIPITDASTNDRDLYGPPPSGNERYVKMGIPELYPASAKVNIRKQTAASSHDDIQINMMMSANIPGPSRASRENTFVKTALSSGPISSYLSTVSFPQAEVTARSTTQNKPSEIDSEFNKLEISSSISDRGYLGGLKGSEEYSSSSSSVLEPEISLESLGTVLTKKDQTFGKQIQKSQPTKPKVLNLPSYPPLKTKDRMTPQESTDKAPSNSLMQSFLGQTAAKTASVVVPKMIVSNVPVTEEIQGYKISKSVPVSPVRGFRPIKPSGSEVQTTISNYPKRSFSTVFTQPLSTPHILSPNITSYTENAGGLQLISPTVQKVHPLDLSEHSGLGQLGISSSLGQTPILNQPQPSTFAPKIISPGPSTTGQGLFEQAAQSSVSSGNDPYALSVSQPPKLKKIIPGQTSKPKLSESTLNEVIDFLDPYKSSEHVGSSQRDINFTRTKTPELDVGNYIMEPEKSLLKETYPCSSPLHPDRCTMNIRVDTFPPTFPVYASCASISDIAEAGFFSIGSHDEICCWYCGMSAAGWCTSLDPWVKHCLELPSCEFLLRNRGKEFVKNVCKDPTWLSANRSKHHVKQYAPPTVRTNLSDGEYRLILAESLQTDLVRNLLSMGFENKVIIQLMKERVMRLGEGYTEIEDALDDLERLDPDLMDLITDVEEMLLPRPATPEPVREPVVEEPTEPEPETSEPSNTEPEPQPHHSRMESPWRSRLSEQEETDMRRELKRLKEEKRCKVCLDRDSCMIFTPCGHICACADCTKSLRKCPICRQRIERSYHTYSS